MNILIIRLSSLGDVVLTQSTAAVLREQYPDARLHFITKKAFVPIIEAFGCIDKIHIWEEYKSFSKLLRLGRNNFDLVIDLHNKFNTFLIKTIVNGKRTITYNKKHGLRRKIVKHKTSETISSTVDLYFSIFSKLGISVEVKQPKLYPQQFEKSLINKLKYNDKQLIGIFPGALHKTKQYPIEQTAKVINNLSDSFRCILLGSSNELPLSEKLASLSNKEVTNLCGKLSISELISAINSMDIILSNDSGPMHIAAALRKKQIAIFGATHPKLGFAPMNKQAIVISADLDCQPCSLHGSTSCPLDHFNCMKSIIFTEIISSIENLNSNR